MRKSAPILVALALVAVITFALLNRPDDPPVVRPTVKTDAGVATAEARAWPQSSSDIPADDEIQFGHLDNGLRFLIRPNPEPPGRVSLRLHIDAGSLMEADDQQGIAHFLEHMVFNGTKNYTPEELIPRMQRLGIAFGAHANAYTSFNETVYMLDLPNLEEDTLKLAFNVMRDFADGALLETSEIDKERGVILAELTSRDSVGYRMMKQQFSELLPGSLLTQRFPIGTEEVIKDAPRERFVDFYTRYYTPARMTFVAVGDVDPAAMEQQIRAAFDSAGNPSAPGPDPDLGPVVEAEGIQAAVFHDKELTSTEVSLLSVAPYQAEQDNRATRAKRMPVAVAHAMLNRRFARLAKEEGSPISSGSSSRDVWFRHVEAGSVDVTAADDRWQDALPVLEQEFRRALEHGFTADEFADVRATLVNGLEQAVKREPSRKSDGLATGLVRAINDESVMSSPATNLEIGRDVLDGLDPAKCHAAFREFWTDAGLHLVLTTKEPPADAEKQLLAIYEKSRSQAVDPPQARERQDFAYSSFGTPGTVTERGEIDDLAITQLTLSNGVKVNLKPTDFEANSIHLLARISGCGSLTQPLDKPGLGMFATAMMEGGGLGKHSGEDLKSILSGRNVDSSFSIGEEALQFGGRTTPEDLALQLRLMCAHITDPGLREEALRQFRKGVPMLFQQLRHTPAGGQAKFGGWLHGDDPRFLPPPDEATLLAYEADDARNWLGSALAGAPIELSIVGDFKTDTLLPLLLETFGSLDRSASIEPIPETARRVEFPARPAERRFEFQSKVPQGIALIAWKTDGMRGKLHEARRLNILASILSDRLREEVREKLGASYSPGAGADGSEFLEDFGFLVAYSLGKPEDVDRLANLAIDLADKLALDGANEDELDRARQPFLTQLEKTLRDNSYWLATVMARSQADPTRIEMARDRESDYRGITLEEINTLAKKYYTKANALQGKIVSTE